METSILNPAAVSRQTNIREHVIIIHEKLAKRKCDRYILNLALGYQEIGYKVTILTSSYDKNDAPDCIRDTEQIKIVHSAWWIPRSILGLFKSKMSILKAAWMAFRVIFMPPDRSPPRLVILDVSMIALYILHVFSYYKKFYVATFEDIKNSDICSEHSRYYPSLLEAKWIKLANEVIVETAGFAEIFKKSFPSVKNEPLVFYPSIDYGLWNEAGINVHRIIPDLLENAIIFLSIGRYKRSSNFKLAMDAFEKLLYLIDNQSITERFQLVIAGNSKTLDERTYYEDLVASAREKMCASQITFLRQLPTIHEKTLISESAVMIHPARNDVYSDFLLKAMHLGKPIIATNQGIASKLLVNRISGITTDPDPNAIALVLKKIMMNPHLQVFMGDIAKDAFRKGYSFDAFCKKLCFVMKKPLVRKKSAEMILGETAIQEKIRQ